MAIQGLSFTCPRCAAVIQGPFTGVCPSCGFNDQHLTGIQTSSFQSRKWHEHHDLLTGNKISLYGKTYNASFDLFGDQSLQEVIRYAITFGSRTTLPSSRGNHINQVIVSYIPAIIGSGVTAYSTGVYACSGVSIISPQSYKFGHPFPILDAWVSESFQNAKTRCTLCGAPTQFGYAFCAKCHAQYGSNWQDLMKT